MKQFTWTTVETTLKLNQAFVAALRSGNSVDVTSARAKLEGRSTVIRFLCDLAGDVGTTVSALTIDQAKTAFEAREGRADIDVIDVLEHGGSRTQPAN